MVFRSLREQFGINENDYLQSWTSNSPVATKMGSKSPARFFTSNDKLFIMKTLTSEEVEQMHYYLKSYYPVSICPEV